MERTSVLDALEATKGNQTKAARKLGISRFALIRLMEKHDLKKKICIGAVSHRSLQADRPEDVAGEIRKALRYIPPERLIVSSDCGFGRQGCNREIAFYKASAIAQGCDMVRQELGLEGKYVPAADPALQLDIVSKTAQ